MQALILANCQQNEGEKIQMLEFAWSVSNSLHGMECMLQHAFHSTEWSVAHSKNALRVEWNGMPELEYNNTRGTRLLQIPILELCPTKRECNKCVASSLVPSVLLYSDSGIPFHSTLSAFLECDTLHSVEWNGCCNMHSIPWSECVRTHSRHIPLFEFSRFKRFRG